MHFVIVLGYTLQGAQPHPILAARLLLAYSLYSTLSRNQECRIVCSGGRPAGRRVGPTEAQAMAEFLRARGVPPGSLMLEERSANTDENLVFSRLLINVTAGGAPADVAVVTSAFHLPRTKLLAASLFPGAYFAGAAASPEGGDFPDEIVLEEMRKLRRFRYPAQRPFPPNALY